MVNLTVTMGCSQGQSEIKKNPRLRSMCRSLATGQGGDYESALGAPRMKEPQPASIPACQVASFLLEYNQRFSTRSLSIQEFEGN